MALVGGSISVALWPERTPAGFRCAPVVGALFGVCSDADYLLSRLRVLAGLAPRLHPLGRVAVFWFELDCILNR
jgi:hypothetical protein